MKKNILSAFCILAVVLSACQKQVDFTEPIDPPVTPPVVSDSTLIRKLIELDTTKTAPFDTVSVQTFTYDAQKRVISNYYFDYNNTGAIDSSIYFIMNTNIYNGIDTLPFKITSIFKDQDHYYQTIFRTYSAGCQHQTRPCLPLVQLLQTQMYIRKQESIIVPAIP